MAVLSIGPLTGNEMDLGKLTESRAVRHWLARTNNRFTGEIEIFNYGIGNNILPIPYITRLPSNQILLCRRLKAKQEKSPLHWIVTAEYSSEPLTTDEQDNELPPLQRRAKRDWTTVRNMEAVYRDNEGKACVNAAGDYFDPPLERPRSHWVVNVKKNVPDVPTYLLQYADGINQAAWTVGGITFLPRTGMLLSIAVSDLQTEQIDDTTYEYYIFSYSVEHNPHEWVSRPLQMGFRYKDTNGDIKNIQTDDTPPRDVTSPRLLDALGGILADPSPETAVFAEFDINNEVNFEVLPTV